jgi:hypothetical protein
MVRPFLVGQVAHIPHHAASGLPRPISIAGCTLPPVLGRCALVRFSSGKEELSATTVTSLGIPMVEVSKGVIDCCWVTIVQALFCLAKALLPL